VALSAYKSVRLEAAELIDFFEEEEALSRSMAEHALRYANEFVTEAEEDVRPEDVIEVLVPALNVSEKLRAKLARMPQQYWYLWFGELIVDRLWDKLSAKAKKGRKAKDGKGSN
jgi:hypothetical protein